MSEANLTFMTPYEMFKAERERQVSAEGYTHQHDDAHTHGELSEAASCYAKYAAYQELVDRCRPGLLKDKRPFVNWPWENESWKPTESAVNNLVKAGALIVAEIERIQRRVEATQTQTGKDARNES